MKLSLHQPYKFIDNGTMQDFLSRKANGEAHNQLTQQTAYAHFSQNEHSHVSINKQDCWESNDLLRVNRHD